MCDTCYNKTDLTGEYEDKDYAMARGDSRISVQISRDADTAKFNRTMRFLIDDPLSSHPLAYTLSKPLKLGWHYASDKDYEGVYKFVLQEVETTDDDNQELMIADYYKHFPENAMVKKIDPETNVTDGGKVVWL